MASDTPDHIYLLAQMTKLSGLKKLFKLNLGSTPAEPITTSAFLCIMAVYCLNSLVSFWFQGFVSIHFIIIIETSSRISTNAVGTKNPQIRGETEIPICLRRAMCSHNSAADRRAKSPWAQLHPSRFGSFSTSKCRGMESQDTFGVWEVRMVGKGWWILWMKERENIRIKREGNTTSCHGDEKLKYMQRENEQANKTSRHLKAMWEQYFQPIIAGVQPWSCCGGMQNPGKAGLCKSATTGCEADYAQMCWPFKRLMFSYHANSNKIID